MDPMRSYFDDNFESPVYYNDSFELDLENDDKFFKIFEEIFENNSVNTDVNCTIDKLNKDFKKFYKTILNIANYLSMDINRYEDQIVNSTKVYNKLLIDYKKIVRNSDRKRANIVSKIRIIDSIKTINLTNGLTKKYLNCPEFEKIRPDIGESLNRYTKIEVLRDFICNDNEKTLNLVEDIDNRFNDLFKVVIQSQIKN